MSGRPARRRRLCVVYDFAPLYTWAAFGKVTAAASFPVLPVVLAVFIIIFVTELSLYISQRRDFRGRKLADVAYG